MRLSKFGAHVLIMIEGSPGEDFGTIAHHVWPMSRFSTPPSGGPHGGVRPLATYVSRYLRDEVEVRLDGKVRQLHLTAKGRGVLKEWRSR